MLGRVPAFVQPACLSEVEGAWRSVLEDSFVGVGSFHSGSAADHQVVLESAGRETEGEGRGRSGQDSWDDRDQGSLGVLDRLGLGDLESVDRETEGEDRGR